MRAQAKRVFISADHGLAIIYFLQSEVVSTLLNAGVEVVLLSDDDLVEQIQARFGRPGLDVTGLRVRAARKYLEDHGSSLQYWIDFLRRAGASNKINLQAVESYILQVEGEAQGKRRLLFSMVKPLVKLLRSSRLVRRALVRLQRRYSPDLYADLFERYQPDLVVASTPGWRLDRYLLREAARRSVPTVSVIVGWDNSSSYSLPGADVDSVTCWSEIQRDELVYGSDWDPKKVNVGGIPSYDGYFQREWVLPRESYFESHGLDPDRKLLSYACSFITFSPNIQNVEALAELVSAEALNKPCQLLIRLHPNHFMEVPRFAQEREQIRALAHANLHVHVVEPVPLGGTLGHYSGEDMPEKSSMMAHSDVFLTVYSTMVVEAIAHGRPVVSVCLDSPVGWPGKFSLPLSDIGGWPTHDRFRESGAGLVAHDIESLELAINHYLDDPDSGRQARTDFLTRECTFTDGSAGRRTGEYLLSLINSSDGDTPGGGPPSGQEEKAPLKQDQPDRVRL